MRRCHPPFIGHAAQIRAAEDEFLVLGPNPPCRQQLDPEPGIDQLALVGDRFSGVFGVVVVPADSLDIRAGGMAAARSPKRHADSPRTRPPVTAIACNTANAARAAASARNTLGRARPSSKGEFPQSVKLPFSANRLRAGQQRHRPGAEPQQRRRRSVRRAGLVTGSDAVPAAKLPSIDKRLQFVQFGHLESLALLGGRDRMGAQTFEIEALGLGSLRPHGQQRPGAEFGRFSTSQSRRARLIGANTSHRSASASAGRVRRSTVSRPRDSEQSR